MFGLGKNRKRNAKASDKRKAVGAASSEAGKDVAGPSLNPMTNLVLADVALRVGGTLLRLGVERAMLGRAYTPQKAKKVVHRRSLRKTLFGATLARVATRSVPGAIVVGGGMLAKTLYDRTRGDAARRRGSKAIDRQARRVK
jgi:hypothetical protein